MDGPLSNVAGVLIKGEVWVQIHTQEEYHVTVKAEIGVLQQQAKGYQNLPASHQKEAGRAKSPCSFQKERGPASVLVWDF